MSEQQFMAYEIYARGKENFKKRGFDWGYPGGKIGPSVRANRKFLDSLFYETKFFDPVDSDTSCSFLGVKLRTPVFCSAISKTPDMPGNGIADIASGVATAGSAIMLGIGGSDDLQSAIDTGANVIKIVKPYRETELIYEKVREAESKGCKAVGMDIDHFYGVLLGDMVKRTNTFRPQRTSEIQQIIAQTKLPFIIKGVLSVSDAEKAVELGAAAIVVSNHGSGAFDFSVPSMIALPKIVSSVGKKVTVLVDTGFETGTDVFKALAFGAKAVGFASSMILASAADGSKGVEFLIDKITAELSRTMMATGCSSLSAINRSIISQVS